MAPSANTTSANNTGADETSVEKAGGKKSKGVDPTWPKTVEDDHVLTEFTADRQGSLSPYGDTTFPLARAELSYVHPKTVINR